MHENFKRIKVKKQCSMLGIARRIVRFFVQSPLFHFTVLGDPHPMKRFPEIKLSISRTANKRRSLDNDREE